MKKNIAVFTSTRADYGLLRRVCQNLHQDSNVNLLLVATGSHLSAKYGFTVQEIEADNIPISAKIDILKYDNTPFGIAKTIAFAIQQYSEWFCFVKPDALLVLGDRYEIFAAVTAAAALDIPIAHISGGDVTLGAKDDYYRHCITKMSKLHFPSCEEYAKRVIRLGEVPSTVHNVGALGDENIRIMPLMGKEELFKSLNIKMQDEFLLVTFHPETIGDISPEEQTNALLNALKSVNVFCIITKANADAGGEQINKLLDEFAIENENFAVFDSLGVKRYLSAMKYCTAVVGNSSSGMIETPSFGVPCVNIGDRQKGRIVCQNIICANCNEKEIFLALEKAVRKDFRHKAAKTQSPYNGGDTAKQISDILVENLQSETLQKAKEFYDGGT